MGTTEEDELAQIVDDVMPEYTGVDESHTVWVSISIDVMDEEQNIDPEQAEKYLYDWMLEFLNKGLFRYDRDDRISTIKPAQSGSWNGNELIAQYDITSYSPNHNEFKPTRTFYIMFPVSDHIAVSDINRLWEQVEELIETHNPFGEHKIERITPPSIISSSVGVSESLRRIRANDW